MNSYIQLMSQIIEHIEENINESLTLLEISKKFYISEFHLSRIFKILTGYSMKQYIQGRKLTLVAEKLKNSECTITMAAMDSGYKSPEVFSRAFQKQFGIYPSVYRKSDMEINMVAKVDIVIRDMSNLKGSLTLRNSFLHLESTELYGIYTEVNENSSDFEQILYSTGSKFIQRYSKSLKEDKFYSMVSCHGNDIGKYTVFIGGNISEEDRDKRLKVYKLPEGWYACFHYYGEMLDIRNTFVEDLYRWIILKEIELKPCGIGMLDIFNLSDLKDVNILVPIKAPKKQQKTSCRRRNHKL